MRNSKVQSKPKVLPSFHSVVPQSVPEQSKSSVTSDPCMKNSTVKKYENFDLHSMPKDGDCFYSAVSFALFRSLNGSFALRQIVQNYIFQYWKFFSKFTTLSKFQFLSQHVKPGVFATSIQVQAASSCLGIPIFVHTPSGILTFNPFKLAPYSGGPSEIHLKFTPPYDSGHFDCLLPSNVSTSSWHLNVVQDNPVELSTKSGNQWFEVGRKGKKIPIADPVVKCDVTVPPPSPVLAPVPAPVPIPVAAPVHLNPLAAPFVPEKVASCSKKVELVNLMYIDYKLFPVTVYVDGLKLRGHLDTAASRSIIHSKFCTDRSALKPTDMLIQVANNNIMQCDGVYNPSLRFGSDFTLNHPLLVAEISVDLILGDDFLSKVKANLSYGSHEAVFHFRGKSVTVVRLAVLPKHFAPPLLSPPPPCHFDECTRLSLINVPEAHTSNIQVFSSPKVVTLAPQTFTTVPVYVNFPSKVLPAVLTPKTILGVDYLYTVECFLSDTMSVPVFNGSDDPIELPPSTKLGSICFEDRNLSSNDISRFDLNSLIHNLSNGCLDLTPEQVQCVEQCSVAKEDDRPALPSVSGCNLSKDEKLQVRSVLEKYRDVFGYKLKPGSFVPNIFANLELKESGNYFKKNWPWSLEQQKLAEIQVQKLLNEGVITESFTNNFLPVFIILKRGSTVENPVGRLLLDARALNRKLHEYKFKQTTIDECLQYCADKKYLSVGDVVSYFHTIRLTPESTDLLGFQVGQRRYKFLRLPFGLKTSPQIAQATMASVLQGLDVKHYVDDIVMGGKTFDEALSVFESVLKRFRSNNLLMRPDKTELFQKSISLLGMKVAGGSSVSPDPSRFRPLLSLDNPKTPKQVKSSICFLSYFRRFIPNFALKTKHMNEIACEKVPFSWSEADRQMIQDMYNHLLKHATLSLFNPALKTKLHVDGSKVGIGGFLSQAKNKYFLPVGFFSKDLKVSQRTWSAYHIECLALYECVRYFEKELLLLEKFTVVTDASSLKYLLQMQAPKAPFDKFIAYLSKFSFDYELVPSERNKIPDALSRLPQPPAGCDVVLPPNLTTYFTPVQNNKSSGASVFRTASCSFNDYLPSVSLPNNHLLQVQTRAMKKLTDSAANPPPDTSSVTNRFVSSVVPPALPPSPSPHPTYDCGRVSPSHIFSDPTLCFPSRNPHAILDYPNTNHYLFDPKLEPISSDTGQFEFLSNDFPCVVSYDSKNYASISDALNDLNIQFGVGWKEEYLDVLDKLLISKFSYNSALKTLLLSTGMRPIFLPAQNSYEFPIYFSLQLMQIRQLLRKGKVQVTNPNSKNSKVVSNKAQPNVSAVPNVTVQEPSVSLSSASNQDEIPPQGSSVPSDSISEEVFNELWDPNEPTISDFVGCYTFLNNSFPCVITVHDNTYMSVDHAFESLKATNEEDHNYVASAPTASIAKLRGSEIVSRPDFDDEKLSIMQNLVYLKFLQNHDLAILLLDTGLKFLAFNNNDHDTTFGYCLCGQCPDGLNLFGAFLMQIRAKLRSGLKSSSVNPLDLDLQLFNSLPIHKTFIKYQCEDPVLSKLYNRVLQQQLMADDKLNHVPKFKISRGLLVTNTKVERTVVPSKLVPFVLNEFHDLCMHSGIRIMLNSISKFYFWTNMYKDIETYVKSCLTCGEFKASNQNLVYSILA
ncbi:uncharacterized protein LOC117641709 [Thrips palmi]|uniref:RNA-directed DNA polymerase n=1 Tax=Thrips palmi TaxID=161013 RepID=A0A6P8YM95_THRPL|nr:uncharacterized protein LOC117641709 [Thrips palmi]